MSEQTVTLNKQGFSLVEVMIALVVLLLVFMALMQTALVSINANMNNVLRDEAVSIAEQAIMETRNTDFATLAEGTTALHSGDDTYRKYFRNLNILYTVTRVVTDRGVNNKQIEVAVTWTWKGEAFTHNMSTIRMRP